MNDLNVHSTKYRLNSLSRLFQQNDSASSVFTVGLAYMLVAVMFFSVMSVLAKLVSPTIPTGQIVFVRACVGSLLAYWGVRLAGVHLWGVNKKLLWFREEGKINDPDTTRCLRKVRAHPVVSGSLIFPSYHRYGADCR